MKKVKILIIMLLLITTVSFAETTSKKIDVIFNKVNIEVNNQKVQADNILYEGTTYVPLRTVAEMMNKEITWDASTNTAGINDKVTQKYAETKPQEQTQKVELNEIRYIGNRNSKKLHKADCRYGEKTLEENREYFKNKQDAINKGYVPCKVCSP